MIVLIVSCVLCHKKICNLFGEASINKGQGLFTIGSKVSGPNGGVIFTSEGIIIHSILFFVFL